VEESVTYEELESALIEFELPPRVSLHRIRERHRQLVRQYHPDRCPERDDEKIRRINAAYQVLSDYVANYRFDFSRDEFLQQYPEERLREQFWSEKPWGENV
jgi:curved DNA-binding protein CbpA